MMESDRKLRLYQDAIERVTTYNATLTAERNGRKYFWEQFTNMRHSKCHLWVRHTDRAPGILHGQAYSYPARRWRVDKSFKVKDIRIPPISTTKIQPAYQTRSTTERPRTRYREVSDSDESGEEEEIVEEQWDYGEAESSESETQTKRRSVPSAMKRKAQPTAQEESVMCQMCGRLCKNQQGLRLHFASYPTHEQAHQDSPAASSPVHQATVEENENKPLAAPNNYCDFCLGGRDLNKKTNKPERLISCADCGRSGHPSCLQFTDQLVENVLKYRWQCIECKSCGFCGNSDNDDQLLFCDDCDRGYHMFCLKPPISSPPEGRWVCVLCTQGTGRGRRKA